MAMGIGDANDVQTLIAHVYGLNAGTVEEQREHVDEVEAAAHRLADRSHKVLMAGRTSRDLLTRPVPA